MKARVLVSTYVMGVFHPIGTVLEGKSAEIAVKNGAAEALPEEEKKRGRKKKEETDAGE